MLKRLHDTAGQDTALALSQVDSLAPFTYGLEYSAPARGGWTIVHIGMLLPESHQVFVCAQSCLRGVVLSAAELGDSSRFSTISVDEDSVLEGNCEEIIIEGVAHILEGTACAAKGPAAVYKLYPSFSGNGYENRVRGVKHTFSPGGIRAVLDEPHYEKD